MQTNAGRRSNCLPCYPIPGTSSLPSSPCQQPLITTFVAEKTKEKFTLFANAAATACGCLPCSIFRFSFSFFVERKIAEY